MSTRLASYLMFDEPTYEVCSDDIFFERSLLPCKTGLGFTVIALPIRSRQTSLLLVVSFVSFKPRYIYIVLFTRIINDSFY
jgi:hypothetical protein